MFVEVVGVCRMDKKQAAKFLGVSVRAIERYVQQGKISVRYEKGKTRSVAVFDQSELEHFMDELNQPNHKPAVELRQNSSEQQSDLARYSGEVSEFGEINAIEHLATIIESLINREPGVSVGEKLLLTLAEVQQLTGLSREYLREAVATEELKAKVIGKSWRVKRADLDEYINKIF